MLPISESEVITRLRFDNPWWDELGIEERFEKLPRRQYFSAFHTLLTDTSINRAVVLMGPRRVGKTVIVYHAISELLKTGVNPNTILYLCLETPIYTGLTLDNIRQTFAELFSHKRSSPLYIFFDEVQYHKDWETHLKSLVDSYPSYRFTATGSAAAALRLKSKESGAGRFTDFLLPPLTFSEYVSFVADPAELLDVLEYQDEMQITAKNINEFNQHFINYMNFGGYPEAVFSETVKHDVERFIKSDIIDKVLLRDLPSLYGISDTQELNQLFTMLAYNTGQEISLEALSKSANLSKNTLKRYIEYLEAAFLIKIVHRVDQNSKKFKRATAFKVYLTNPSMRAALLNLNFLYC